MSQIIIEHLHGAASRVPVESTACALRVTGFNVVIIAQWADDEETDLNIAWARETFAALAPHVSKRRYVNYLERDATDAGDSVFGSNLGRLRDVKTKWDPDNVFHHNVNIAPR